MTANRRNNSSGIKPVLALCAVIVGVTFGGGYLAYHQRATEVRRGAAEHQKRELSALKTVTEQATRTLVESMESWARHPAMMQILDDDGDLEIADLVDTVAKRFTFIRQLSCVARSGKVLASTRTLLERERTDPHPIAWEEFLRNRRATIIPNDATVVVTVPVFWQFDERELLGALRATVTPAGFLAGPVDWWAGLVTASGKVLAQKGARLPGQIDLHAQDKAYPDVGRIALVAVPFEFPAGVSGPNWYQAIADPYNSLFAQVGVLKSMFVWMTGGGACVMVALVIGYTRRQDVLIKRLAERGTRLNAEIIERKQREDEIRRLNQGLEQRVVERTVDLQEARNAAQASDRAKSAFLANMSHEIRTPMTAILGFAENMLDAEQPEAAKLKCIHTIRRNGVHLLDIINDILDLSKIEAGKMSIEWRPCSPCRIIADVASLMRVRADAKELPFNIEYIGAIPETIRSDSTRLRQILINLIGNAIKFTETGAVRLLTRVIVTDGNEPRLQFDVIDTGRGMTEEQKNKLFQPFTQADTSTTRKFGGTGLGLAVSKRFAELLGGDISVPATDIGVGTTFRVTVATGPLDIVKMLEDPMTATVAADIVTATPQAAPPDLRDLRILLAEDGPDNQRLISFVLNKAGAEMTVRENGKLALDVALAARDAGKPFDVILMDIQMPVMDGYEATRLLRQENYPGPIIALTAHAMEGDRERCLVAGCNDYATKPINRKKLIKLILENVRDHHHRPVTNLAESPERPALQQCRILLAEDNLTNQVLIAGILKKAGAQITTVKDGKLALDTAFAAREDCRPFDVILMDIQMPLMGGVEATRILREKGYTGKIISLTADTRDGDEQRYLSMGFDDAAWKPINRAILIETIRRHLVPAEAAAPVAT